MEDSFLFGRVVANPNVGARRLHAAVRNCFSAYWVLVYVASLNGPVVSCATGSDWLTSLADSGHQRARGWIAAYFFNWKLDLSAKLDWRVGVDRGSGRWAFCGVWYCVDTGMFFDMVGYEYMSCPPSP